MENKATVIDKGLDLGKTQGVTRAKQTHIPSKIQADTLFNFTTHLDYLLDTLTSGMISARYCDEDIRYLKIKRMKRISYPMRCFCDINMHKLDEHLSWYGYYGIAFSKEWGMTNGIQPVQYINPQSTLCDDFSKAFSKALKIKPKTQTMEEFIMKSFLLHQLLYLKPYSGRIKNRNTNKKQKKCFTDECEWRFIPDVSKAGFCPLYYDEHIINAGNLVDISNAMSGLEEASLKFKYSDIKYIIVKTEEDFVNLAKALSSLKLEENEEKVLISKVIIWDKSRGDF